MRNPQDFHVRKPDDIDRMIAVLVANDLPHRAVLLRAVRAGVICLVEARRDAIIARRTVRTAGRPVLVLLGDDDDTPTGPDGWATLPNLLHVARGAMIHGTGADIPSYRMAVGMAVLAGAFDLVETTSARVHEWGERFLSRRIPTIGLLPPSGSHPIAARAGGMQ